MAKETKSNQKPLNSHQRPGAAQAEQQGWGSPVVAMALARWSQPPPWSAWSLKEKKKQHLNYLSYIAKYDKKKKKKSLFLFSFEFPKGNVDFFVDV